MHCLICTDTYSNFSFQTNFTLNVGAFHGTIDDRLTYHNGMPFSTKDKDQDTSSSFNCATKFTGAWWYKSCYASNLNGQNYGTSDPTPYGKGITWNAFSTPDLSLKWDIMAIRSMNVT